jgi:hypothetical protein
MKCEKAFSSTNSCVDGANNVVVGGYGAETENWFPRLLEEFDVKKNDIEVLPVTMQVIGAPDTYLMRMEVYQAESDCEAGNFISDIPWQSKRFHIVLN